MLMIPVISKIYVPATNDTLHTDPWPPTYLTLLTPRYPMTEVLCFVFWIFVCLLWILFQMKWNCQSLNWIINLSSLKLTKIIKWHLCFFYSASLYCHLLRERNTLLKLRVRWCWQARTKISECERLIYHWHKFNWSASLLGPSGGVSFSVQEF